MIFHSLTYVIVATFYN